MNKTLTFFERFEADILAAKKVITIRDESESHYQPGSVVEVETFEDGRWFCQLQIDSVMPILFTELNDYHAAQENMTLPELQAIIKEIYPQLGQLYVLEYHLV